MNLPAYDVDPKAEASWIAVGAAAGTLVGAVLAALDVEAGIAAAAASLTAGLVRLVIGHFLPASAKE